MPIIITVSGQARHGKNSFCDILQIKLNELNKKSLIINYADYLKYLAKQYYGWNGQKDEAGRTLLQQLGTEKIRSKKPDFWVDTVINFINVVKDDFDFILIGDCRFSNEINKWLEKGYKTISIHVTRTNFDNGLTLEQKNHASEIALNGYEFDYYIGAENLEELEKEVDKFILELKEEGTL